MHELNCVIAHIFAVFTISMVTNLRQNQITFMVDSLLLKSMATTQKIILKYHHTNSGKHPMFDVLWRSSTFPNYDRNYW